MAAMYENLLADRDQWRARATEIESAGKSYRDLYEENLSLKLRVSELRFDLAQANRQKAGYLPEGTTGSTRLKPGQSVPVGIVA